MSRPTVPDRPNKDSAPSAGAAAVAKRKITLLKLKSPVRATEERLYRIDKERIVIGSMVSAEVQLEGQGIAPIHAVLEVTRRDTPEARAVIYDLASDGGLTVNDKKVVAEELKPGDRIGIGKHQLVFEFEERKVGGAADRYRTGEGRDLFFNPKEDLSPLLLENLGDVTEIFDYAGSSEVGLQVTMSWFDAILDVQHFSRRRSVTVGASRANDFAIPPLLGPKAYSIVSRSDQGYVINLESSMKGVLQREGKLQSLDEARLDSTRGPSGSNNILLKNGDFAKISIGDVDFYFAFTPAPPRLKRRGQGEKDPLYWRIIVVSMALTGAFIYALLNARVPANLEAEKIPERIATILYQPEKFPPRPEPRPEKPADEKPPEAKLPEKQPTAKATPHKVDLNESKGKPLKEVPKVMTTQRPAAEAKNKAASSASKANSRTQSESREGEGAKAAGRSGTRGSPKAAPGKNPQDAAKRPSANPGRGRGGGQSQVGSDGNVDFLKGAGAKIENILAGSSAKLGADGSKIAGFGNFATQGGDGLALSGDARGGGGNAQTTLGGLGNKGTGGGKVGTGRGAIGSGNGIIGGEARLPPIRKGGVEEAVVVGAIDKDAIEAALAAHKDEFRLCYEREINAERPNLSGRVGVTFVIGSTGAVTKAGVESTSLKSPPVERCVVQVIKRIAFPIPLGGGIVEVTKGFKFDPLRAGGA